MSRLDFIGLDCACPRYLLSDDNEIEYFKVLLRNATPVNTKLAARLRRFRYIDGNLYRDGKLVLGKAALYAIFERSIVPFVHWAGVDDGFTDKQILEMYLKTVTDCIDAPFTVCRSLVNGPSVETAMTCAAPTEHQRAGLKRSLVSEFGIPVHVVERLFGVNDGSNGPVGRETAALPPHRHRQHLPPHAPLLLGPSDGPHLPPPRQHGTYFPPPSCGPRYTALPPRMHLPLPPSHGPHGQYPAPAMHDPDFMRMMTFAAMQPKTLNQAKIGTQHFGGTHHHTHNHNGPTQEEVERIAKEAAAQNNGPVLAKLEELTTIQVQSAAKIEAKVDGTKSELLSTKSELSSKFDQTASDVKTHIDEGIIRATTPGPTAFQPPSARAPRSKSVKKSIPKPKPASFASKVYGAVFGKGDVDGKEEEDEDEEEPNPRSILKKKLRFTEENKVSEYEPFTEASSGIKKLPDLPMAGGATDDNLEGLFSQDEEDPFSYPDDPLAVDSSISSPSRGAVESTAFDESEVQVYVLFCVVIRIPPNSFGLTRSSSRCVFASSFS